MYGMMTSKKKSSRRQGGMVAKEWVSYMEDLG